MAAARGRFVVELSVAALVATVVVAFVVRSSSGPGSSIASALAGTRPSFASDDPVARGCALDKTYLTRIWRGHDSAHSEDVTMVPRAPNYFGSFDYRGHSGPWDYLQRVPLVLYGPRYIRAAGEVTRPSSITDVYPTVGKLLHVPLPDRSGHALTDALKPGGHDPPKLVVVVMWDGVGRNVLQRWPADWPTLKQLEAAGTSYRNATVGSSPSITPATHSNLGTGTWPRNHGVTGIEYRADSGTVRTAFGHRNPADLKLPTFADIADKKLGNNPKVGMLAWRSWHLGMLGHGSAYPGGDKDELALIGRSGKVSGNPSYFRTPAYVRSLSGLQTQFDRLDRSDGRVDGSWRGHDIAAQEDNPAWVRFESGALRTMLTRGDYGADRVPDIFLVNFKATDIVGHLLSMDDPQMGAVLRAQDAALGRLVDYLDREVGNYVVVVSADHGHTPSAPTTGAWPVFQGELAKDIDDHFHAPPGTSLVVTTSATGPFLDHALMQSLDITGDDVARFLNGYTIRDNWAGGDLPPGYEDRGAEEIFSAAFSSAELPRVMTCAFGAPHPPPGPAE
jgi:hypothetical protein